ncbi:MAG: hypothetical protein L3J66_04880 [Bacteroidales bacterium]|nr:hypothetical protein [Bacteroidales bacterium]
MMFAFKNYSSGNAFGRPGYNNSQLAKHGIDVGAKMMTSSSYSADGQINFDFSKTAVESAMSGTGTAMGMGKNANAASSYTAVITLDEAEVLAPASMVMVLTRSRGNPIFFGIGLGLFLREVYDGFAKWNPGYSHKKREDWRNSEKARKQSSEHLNIQSRNGMKNDIFGNGPNGGPPLGMLPSAYFGMRAIQLIYQYFDNTDVKMPQKPVDNGEQQISPTNN